MHSWTLLFLITAISFPVFEVEGSSHKVAKKFTIRAVPNSNYVPHGPAAILKAHKKRAKSVPCHLEKLVLKKRLAKLYRAFRDINDPQVPLRKRAQSVDIASPVGEDIQYLCPVQVGDVTLNLEFDTGSADLWVFSSDLPADERKGHRYYSPSVTAVEVNGSTWSVGYGDGSKASGNVYSDTVTVGSTVVENQAVQLAQDVSESFASDLSSDGILGLAFSNLNSVNPDYVNTFFDNAKANLPNGLFAVDLRHKQPGAYDFGFIDTTRYIGSIQWAPLDRSRGYWGFAANKGYKVGSKKYADAAPNGAIADTGTTLLLMSSAVVKNYYSRVKGAYLATQEGGWVFPCTAKLPTLSVGFGPYYVPINTAYMIYNHVSTTVCFGGLQTLASDNLPYIYGDIFMKSFYVVFDDANSQVGVAKKTF